MNKPGIFKLFNLILVSLLLSTFVFAKVSDKTYQLVEKNLAEQLKQDLVEKSLTIKFKNVDEYKISNTTINLVGDAYCVLNSENTQLPIHFEAVVNTSKDEITYINYKFVEETPYDTSLSNEEMVTQAVMERIHKDFDTTNIVFTITALERNGNSNKFIGFGEVKIDDLALRKVKFDVEFDEISSEVKVGSYEFEKL